MRNQQKKKSKVPLILWSIFGILILLIVIYVIIKIKKIDISITKFLTYSLGILGGLILLGFFIFLAIHFLSKRDTNIKETVSVTKALQIWKNAFMDYNNITYRYPSLPGENKDILIPLRRNAIRFRNIKKFADPTGSTSDYFLSFEAEITDGDRTGMLVAVFSLDFGEEYIQNNAVECIKWNSSYNTYDINIMKTGMRNAMSFGDRMSVRMAEMRDEGATTEELQQYQELALMSKRYQPVNIEQKVESVRSPNISDEFSSSDEKNDAQELQKDVDKYRGRSK